MLIVVAKIVIAIKIRLIVQPYLFAQFTFHCVLQYQKNELWKQNMNLLHTRQTILFRNVKGVCKYTCALVHLIIYFHPTSLGEILKLLYLLRGHHADV